MTHSKIARARAWIGGLTLAAALPAWAEGPAAAAAPVFNGGDIAWMLISTVLVLLMTMPGIILFYSGMLRTKNALSIVAHTVAAAAVITLCWAMVGYSLAFSHGSPFFGGLERVFGEGLIGKKVGAHMVAPTIPESVFFLFQLSFAIITFALVLGATAERMRLGVTIVFAALYLALFPGLGNAAERAVRHPFRYASSCAGLRERHGCERITGGRPGLRRRAAVLRQSQGKHDGCERNPRTNAFGNADPAHVSRSASLQSGPGREASSAAARPRQPPAPDRRARTCSRETPALLSRPGRCHSPSAPWRQHRKRR